MAVEFALIATVLIVSLGGLIDLITISTLNREIERSSTQIGATITSCSRNTSDGSCVPTTLAMYFNQPNVIVRMPNATISLAQVKKKSGSPLQVCAGNMTYLDSDVSASASAVMNDKDTAVIVLITADYNALLPMITRVFTGQTTSHLRGWTTSVQSSEAHATVTVECS